jgi:HlyD family secretion protein
LKRNWKIIIGVLAAAIVLGFILMENLKGLEADLLEIQPRDIANTLKEEGSVVSEIEQPVYTLYSGEITELHVEEGQQVKKGDLLAVINTRELNYQIQQLKGQLTSLQGEEERALKEERESITRSESMIKSQKLLVEQAERDLKTLETNLERIEALYEDGAVSKMEYEEACNMLEAAKNNLEVQVESLSLLDKNYSPVSRLQNYYAGRKEALNAQINLLEYQIEKCKIISPVEGTAANLTVKKGEIANPGLPLMELFKKDAYLFEVYLLAENVPGLEKGMEVDLRWDRHGLDSVFKGTIKSIAPTAVERISPLGLEEQRVKIMVKPDLPENINLFPGYKLDVEFILDRMENKLVVPKTVLFPYEGGKALWVVRNGKAEVQPVKTGFETGREIVIEEGLQQGDLIILNPQQKGLKKGCKIRTSRF